MVQAQTDTWDGGGGDNNWGTGNNWVDNSSPAPGTGSDLFFAGSTRLNPFNNYTAFDDFRNITFSSGAGAFNITGNAIDLFGKIENLSTTAQTFALSLGVNTSFIEINPVSGNLNVNSANIFLGGNQLRVFGDSGNTLTFGTGTVISGTGGTVAINQNSTVVYQSAHTYTGGTFINAGTLRFNTGGSADSTTLNLGDTSGTRAATLQVASGVTLGSGSSLTVRSGSSGSKSLSYTDGTGTGTVSRGITLNDNLTISAASGGTLTLSGVISGGSGFTNTGAGTIIFSGSSANTATGAGVIASGNTTIFNKSANTAAIAGTLTINSGGTLQTDSANQLNNQLVTVNGTLNLNNNSQQLALAGAGTVSLGSAAITNTNTGNDTFSGQMTGTGSLVKAGAGTLVLSGSNSFSGGTLISGGIIQIANNAALGTGGVTNTADGAGLFTDGSSRTIVNNLFISNNTLIGGTGALQIDGTITVGLSRNLTNNNSGGLTLSNIAMGNSGTSRTLRIAGTGNTTINGVISNAAGQSTNNLEISSSGTTRLNGANTYTGETTVMATGSAVLGNDMALGSTNGGTVVSSGGTLDVNGRSVLGESLTLGGQGAGNNGALRNAGSGAASWTGLITLNTSTVYIGATNNSSLTVSNISGGANELCIVGAGTTTIAGGATNSGSGTALVKTNTGTAVLMASNAWSGNEFIREGTVVLSNNNALGVGGTTTVGADSGTATASLRIGSGITNSNGITIAGGGSGRRTIAYGDGAGTGTQQGSVTQNTGATFDVAAGGTLRIAGTINNAGTVTNEKSGAGTLIFSAASTGGTDNQLKIGNGAVVLGVNNAGTTNTGTTTRAIDLGLDGANTSTANNVALYASNGVTVSNSIYVAPNTGGATRTIGASDSGATVTYNNQIFMAGATRLEAATDSTVTFSGNLTNGSGTNALEKIGSGVVVLNASNNHAGTNVVTAGTLRLGNNRAAGNVTNVVSVTSGAALELSNNISTANPVTLNGTGVGGNGALRNVSGNNTNAGAITLGAASRINSDSGTLTLSGGITGTGQSLTVGGTADTVVSGTGINTSTSGTLTKDGSGVLTVTASGNYTGGTTLTGGTLRGGHDSAFGTGGLQMNGGTISSDSATARSFANTLTLAGDVAFGQSSGGTGSLTFSSTATNNLGGGTRTLTTMVDTKIDGALGNGSLTKAGSGTLYLSNASSSFGTLTINAGRVTFQTNASITGLGGSGGSLQIAGGTLTVNLATNATYTDSISGSGSLAKTGTGTLTLGVANTFAGGSTLSDGVLRVSDTAGLGTGALVQTSGTSTVQFSNAGTVANDMSVYNVAFLTGGNNLSGRITNNNATYDVAAGTTNTLSGFVTGSGGVTKTGEGVLSVTGTTNDYAGTTTISNGTLRVTTLADAGAVSSIGTNATVNFSGTNASTTVLDYTGGNVTTDRSLVFNGVATNGEGGTLRVSNSSTVVTLDGSASGTGRMVVDGGTVVLSNTTTSNNFAPASIQVNSNSILQIAANEQIGNTTDLILNGGTLRLFNGTTGYAETLGTLTLSASSTIDLGAATTLRNITFANSSAITWTGTLTITNWQGVANTTGEAGRLLFGSGGLTSGQMSQVYWAGPGFTGSGGRLIGLNGELVPIPEPRVYAAAIALLAAVGWQERRRILSLVKPKSPPRA